MSCMEHECLSCGHVWFIGEWTCPECGESRPTSLRHWFDEEL